MNISEQVCTLNQSKKLLRLGVVNQSYFVHLIHRGRHEHTGERTQYVDDKREQFPAFTVAELGKALPDDTRSYQFDGCWQIYAAEEDGMNLFIPENVDTEAQARADYLIYILENELTTPEEVNKRLQD